MMPIYKQDLIVPATTLLLLILCNLSVCFKAKQEKKKAPFFLNPILIGTAMTFRDNE